MNKQMRLQTDLEFQQREIMKLNKKYNVLMFGTKIRGGKGFAAEQKISGFFSKSTVDPSYCFLCVDLFSSKVYVYPMKNNCKKLFYEEIEPKHNLNEQMRLQIDLEFQQTEIMKLNKKI